MMSPIAPGLFIKLLITFQTNVQGDFHDYLEVVSEENF